MYDPAVDGGTYAALDDLQQRLQQNVDNAEEDQNINNSDNQTEKYQGESLMSSNQQPPQGTDEDEEDEFDYLLDEDDLPDGASSAEQTWKETRMMELQAIAHQRQVEESHGYGLHRQFHPRRIASIVGLAMTTDDTYDNIGNNSSSANRHDFPPPPLVVWHLYDSQSTASAWLDVFLEEVAAKARGTLFVRSHGRASLWEPRVQQALQQARVMCGSDAKDGLPALVVVKEGVVQTACCRLQDFVRDIDDDDGPAIDRAALDSWLFSVGALDRQTPPSDVCRLRPEHQALLDSSDPSWRQGVPETRDSSSITGKDTQNDDDYYDCGVPGCGKAFYHQHVGVPTSKQDGLVISAETVLQD
jgi:hypothetical protein